MIGGQFGISRAVFRSIQALVAYIPLRWLLIVGISISRTCPLQVAGLETRPFMAGLEPRPINVAGVRDQCISHLFYSSLDSTVSIFEQSLTLLLILCLQLISLLPNVWCVIMQQMYFLVLCLILVVQIGYPPFMVTALSKISALIGLIVSAQASRMRDWR